MERNLSIHISDRSHLNITLNIYNCGNREVELEQFYAPDYYSFYFVKEGKGSFTQCKASHRIQAGECFVVFPNEDSVIKSEHGKPLNVTWVSFSGYLVGAYLNRAKITAFTPVMEDTQDHELEGLFDTLLHVATRHANRYCPIMAQMYSIFAFFLDHAQQEPELQTAPPAMYLMKALDFIDIYYQDDISVEDVAGSVGLTRKALYTIFKQLTGFSTKDYLIYYRMRKATSLLETTTLPIETVAVSVGYRDQFHFSKEFKKNVGVSPSEYRKNVVKDPGSSYLSPIDGVRLQFPVPLSYQEETASPGNRRRKSE
ncbi:MAG: AraC family transcriptional regulator [Clostridiales bacterium]|nr:AraC family transcriptional regulator [Clostridiales bacterium]